MNKRMGFAALAAVALLLPACGTILRAAAPPVTHEPGEAPSGTYQIDPYHTQVIFVVVHLGFTNFYGNFSGATGSLNYAPAAPGTMAVSVSVPVSSISTSVPKLDAILKGGDWLDAARYPAMIFRSVAVTQTGPKTADVAGLLTLHGVTKPLTLHATFIGAGVNLLTHKQTVGFQLSGALRRSDFGVDRFVPLVSDEVSIMIAAAFEK